MPRRPFRRILAALAIPLAASVGVSADATPVGAVGFSGGAAGSAPRYSAAGEPGLAARAIEIKAPDRLEVARHPARSRRHVHLGSLAERSSRAVGRILATEYGWSGEQWTCLDRLWTRESHWDASRRNASSGAYGIPQALPATKMARVAADWRSNPITQITWGLGYISRRYGTPCVAWDHSQGRGYY